MDFTGLSFAEFTEQLSSRAPVPGGGGASAVACALGVSLGAMVGNLTIGKKKYAENEASLRKLTEKAEDLRVRLLNCVNADAEAFEPLSRAYGIPKDAPERAETMEKCLRRAAESPFEILTASCEAIELLREFAEKGSALAVSDAATGAVLCWGAMYGAAVNVKVNTKYMTDRAYAEGLNARVDEMMNKYWKIAEAVYESVYSRL